MTNDANKDCRGADVVADMLLDAIDGSTPAEIRVVLSGRHGSAQNAVVKGRAAISTAIKETARKRRENISRQLSQASSGPTVDVSGMDRGALLRILEQHTANDANASPLTLAARNGRGDLGDDELRSVVRDILRLQSQE